jgi:hypothetical protein
MPTQVKTKPFGLALASAMALMAGLMLLPGCKDEAPQNISTAPPVLPPSAPSPVAEQPKEKPVYVYSGDRFRDPFVPAGTTGSYQADAVFDPQKATVKGIVFGPNAKSAMLAVGSGGTYFIKAGKIFDIMGKPVEGFTAKVFPDKVVISGEADNVFELKIRKEEEKSL